MNKGNDYLPIHDSKKKVSGNQLSISLTRMTVGVSSVMAEKIKKKRGKKSHLNPTIIVESKVFLSNLATKSLITPIMLSWIVHSQLNSR